MDTAKFSFLLFEFFIPYTVGFWIIFGGPENASKMIKNDWENFNDLTFSVFGVSFICYQVFSLSGCKRNTIYISVEQAHTRHRVAAFFYAVTSIPLRQNGTNQEQYKIIQALALFFPGRNLFVGSTPVMRQKPS